MRKIAPAMHDEQIANQKSSFCDGGVIFYFVAYISEPSSLSQWHSAKHNLPPDRHLRVPVLHATMRLTLSLFKMSGRYLIKCKEVRDIHRM